MAVIDRPEVRAQLAVMLLDDEDVQVGSLLPIRYFGVIMEIGWWVFYKEYGINLSPLYTQKEPFSQEILDAFHVELGWRGPLPKKPTLEEDIWL